MVLESIESKGVRTIPLGEYVDNFEGSEFGYRGRLAIAWHSGFQDQCMPDKLKAMAQFAVDRFAYPYNDEEIARITARIVASALGFMKGEIERKQEYVCSEYVFECYKQISINVPYDERGFILPADFPKGPDIRLLWGSGSSAVSPDPPPSLPPMLGLRRGHPPGEPGPTRNYSWAKLAPNARLPFFNHLSGGSHGDL